jgi:pyruvate dehydrogenase E2 component (dihydrolipoamide acetyltransferase)
MATEVVMPRLSDSMEEGTVLAWLVAEGEAVSVGQPIVEIETDKASMSHEAEAGGVLLAIVCREGETAPLGQVIALIGQPGEVVPRALAAQRPPVVTVATAAPPRDDRPVVRIPASPVARRVARALGVDLATIRGTGPGGRVVRADVEAGAASAVGPAAAPAVARRTAESRSTVPEFELRADVDMGACVELRERLRELGADPLPSLNDMVVKASATALREFPRVNGAYHDDHLELYGRVGVGVAVAAEDALVVPVVADADRASLGEIARTTRALAARVREGTITPAELAGATFTVSNLGMFGVDSFSAAINAPQAAILAVGAVRRRPVAGPGDEVVVRPTATLTLGCDHRILYAADGARFLARLRELLEQPLAFAL